MAERNSFQVSPCFTHLIAVSLSAFLFFLLIAFFIAGDVRAILITTSSPRSSAARRQHSTELTTRSSTTGRWRKLSMEQELDMARVAIRSAARRGGGGNKNVSSANVYRNRAAFYRSYREMEKRFKVYVYDEGEPPILHIGPCKNIYTVEGRFIEELELMQPTATSLRTSEPRRAHAFFLPFSVSQMVQFAHQPLSHDFIPIHRLVADYVRDVASKHPFWNRTAGADHFMLSCHDWGPEASRGHPELYANAVRALCNANTSEGFRPGKDVSIPEINLYDGDMPQQLLDPAPGLESRRFLAFFAGGHHGHIRELLFQHWKGRDNNTFPVYEYLPAGLDYYSFMRQARFCLCPSGHEVASPRVVEAIHAECVPVLLSDGYARPFADVLRWEAFSVTVAVADMPRLRKVLEAIPLPEVARLREGVKAVKMHFMLHQPPKRMDMFHMILHSVWLRRLNLRLDC